MSLPEGLKFPDGFGGKTPISAADKVLISDTADNKKTKWVLFSAIQTWIEGFNSSGTTKSTMLDADSHLIIDSADSNKTKRLLHSTLKTIFDARYQFSPRIFLTTGSSSLTPDIDSYDIIDITALSVGVSINEPTGTESNRKQLIIFIKDNGTSRSINWDTAFDSTFDKLPNQTKAGVQMELIFMYNTTTGKWELISTNWKKSAQVITSGTSFTPNFTKDAFGEITALAAGLTIQAPEGANAENGDEYLLYIKDNNTSRALTFNSTYSGAVIPLPTATPEGQKIKLKFRYYSDISKWVLVEPVSDTPIVQVNTSTSTFTHNCSLYTHGRLTAQSASLAMAAPTGTPFDMQEFVMYLKDNGTSRSISWNAAFSGVMAALPASTTAGKQMVFFFVYNSTTSKWELMNTATGV